jgi:alpha/beta superfamily hydrolase
MEDKIFFYSEGYVIEGRLQKSHPEKGIVVTHPHPLYGGSLQNNIVAAIIRVYQRWGWSTLRFNFRGVGRSQGNYSDGIGEQQDVRSAIAYLADQGVRRIDLAGYSFGAWINALSNKNLPHVGDMVMVSPPVAFIDFSSVTGISNLKLVITGGRDDIAPADLIRRLYPKWNAAARFEVIKEADHFYMGFVDQLEAILSTYLEER